MLNRRTLLKGLCAGGAMAMVARKSTAADEQPPARRFRPWDQHAHLNAAPGNTPEERAAFLVKCMDRVGVERIIVSQGYCDYRAPTPVEQFRLENERTMRAAKAFPDRIYGSVFVAPTLLDFSMQELKRCIIDGPMVMIGEIEAEARCNVPEMDPIAEWAVANEVVVLQHEWLLAGGNGPRDSFTYDVVELAKRHPKLQIVAAHLGGNWELGIRYMRDTPNVYAGLAGFDPGAGVVEMAVRELGAERVIWGTDIGGRSFSSQMAKVLSADIPDSAKELILGGNLRRLLTPVLKKKGYAV
jgi:uncharacterized protein